LIFDHFGKLMDVLFDVNFIGSERVHGVFESSRFYLSVGDTALVQLHRQLTEIQIWDICACTPQAHVGVIPDVFVCRVSDVFSIVM
jgi:hypothetical protein